jgi:hypothetical protein
VELPARTVHTMMMIALATKEGQFYWSGFSVHHPELEAALHQGLRDVTAAPAVARVREPSARGAGGRAGRVRAGR